MTKLILFTGKGGVGKSTSAAATALYHANQGQKTLLVSSDPAHSTDDTVGTKVGETPREISPNLFAMNINAVSVTEERRTRMQNAFAATFGKMFPSLLDPENEGLSSVMSINNAIPGIDEWGACEVMGQQFRSGEYDLVVFDTAPTGHTLKALASPSHVKQFILQLRRLKSKLLGKLLLFKSKKADELELCLAEFCDEIDELKSYLSDPSKTQIVLVSIPTEAGFMEFYRTVNYLKSIGLSAQTLVLNHMIPDMGEDTWEIAGTNPAVTMVYHEFRNQQPWIKHYQKVCAEHDLKIIGAVRLPYEPKGVAKDSHLKDFAELICGPDKINMGE
tara:strand:+ start:8508 stop:9503 length:996 start_codon:yes stop_codon:yes gene_type:complete